MNKLDSNSSILEKSEATQRYIQFNLGNEYYAIELLQVKEVVPVPETTSLPNTPAFYLGIMNLRGQVISIIDLRKKLGVKTMKGEREEAVIILEFSGIGVGVIVDSINKVLNIPTSELKEVPDINSLVSSEEIHGVFQGESELSVLLNLEKILNLEEVKGLQRQVA